jgi:hypothetical protein
MLNLSIDKSLAIRAASILYSRWVEAPLPGDKTVGGMNPVYVCGIYMTSVAKITGLSTARCDNTATNTLPGISPFSRTAGTHDRPDY